MVTFRSFQMMHVTLHVITQKFKKSSIRMLNDEEGTETPMHTEISIFEMMGSFTKDSSAIATPSIIFNSIIYSLFLVKNINVNSPLFLSYLGNFSIWVHMLYINLSIVNCTCFVICVKVCLGAVLPIAKSKGHHHSRLIHSLYIDLRNFLLFYYTN